MSAREHAFMAELAAAALGYHRFPDPPEEAPSQQAAFDAVVCGEECDFYFDADDPVAYYGFEQELELLQAIRRAASLINVTDAQRWQLVFRELAKQATKYAQLKGIGA